MAKLTNQNVAFPYYSGNIRLTKVLGHVNLEQFIRAHKYPTDNNKRLFQQIQDCGSDAALKRSLKQQLYSFTPSVYIEHGKKRRYSSVSSFTGLMQLDLDGINDFDLASEIKSWVFEQPECICSYMSPSNNVKALIRIKKVYTKEEYIRVHNAITEKYEETGYFDVATKNAVLPLFLSWDDDILYRDFSEAEEWSREKIVEIEHAALNETPTNFNTNDYSYYEEKTVRIFTNKISQISSDGHPQVRSACLILGSRVGAGYISKVDAENMAKYLISTNSYLKKGTQGYIETAEWAINEGIKNPRYY